MNFVQNGPHRAGRFFIERVTGIEPVSQPPPAAKYDFDLSGIPESDRRLNLGKVAYCHYTNPAYMSYFAAGHRRFIAP